jgi:CRP/FNR family transcriptional regulator
MAMGPGAKATLRALLSHNAARLGLTAAAIEAIVGQSQITHWRAGQRIFDAEDSQDLVNFLVAGAVKVVCHGRGRIPVLVQLVRPGQFFGLASLFDRPRPRQFSAVAHAPAVVAMMSQEVMTNVVADLPPGRALQLMAYSWRALSRLLYEKCVLLTMPLPDRLRYELAVLAHDFGQRHPAGVLIDLPLTQADLAELVVGSRSNVSRCVAELRRTGQLEVVGRRLVLTRRFPGELSTLAAERLLFGT